MLEIIVVILTIISIIYLLTRDSKPKQKQEIPKNNQIPQQPYDNYNNTLEPHDFVCPYCGEVVSSELCYNNMCCVCGNPLNYEDYYN